MNWSTAQITRNVVRINMRADRTAGWEQWFLLSSDRHHDNAHTDHLMEKRHLDEAVERGAGVIDAGDLHCAMQGKFDPRQDRSALREEYQGGDYLDALVREAASFYQPYSDNLVLFGRGNHEQSILRRHETDLTERTVQAIKTNNPATPLSAGGYGGWVVFCVMRHQTSHIVRMKYYHGAGGGGPVTRGVIQTNRMAVYLPDADIVLTGHTHDSWVVPIARERVSHNGRVYHDEQLHIRAGTYKDEYTDGHSGWHVETMKPPKPLGAMWLRFSFQGKDKLVWQTIRAI